jgi:protein PhnA
VEVFDSNNVQLKDGDSVTLIKDLTLKGTKTTIKRGTMVKGIRLVSDEEIECKVDGMKGIILKTCFLKKV